MRLRPKSAKPRILTAPQPRRVEQRIDIERQPVFFAGHAEVGAGVAHGVLLLLLLGWVERLGGAAGGGIVGDVVVGVDVGVADGRHDGDVAVVRVVVCA